MQETDGERIRALEVRVETMQTTNTAILEKLGDIQEELTRYKGFLGGVAFLVSCLGVAIGIAKEWVVRELHK